MPSRSSARVARYPPLRQPQCLRYRSWIGPDERVWRGRDPQAARPADHVEGLRLCLFEAPDPQRVQEVNEAAQVPYNRIVVALDLDP